MKNFIIRLAKIAGNEALKRFKKSQPVRFKSRREIVTSTDLKAEKIIISEIKNKYPNHQILAEESGYDKTDSEYLWIIDPIDGTTNYSFGNPLFGTLIALMKKEKIIMSVGYAPALNELYFAEAGKGAFLNNKRMKVSKEKTLSKSLLTYCHGYPDASVKKGIKILQHFRLEGFDCRQLGSALIELGFTAAGRTEAVMIPGAKPWDLAAGALWIREAGGKVTDFQGKEWQLKSKDIVASNGKIHNELLKFLKKL